MDFSHSPRATELIELVAAFIRDEIEPVQHEYHRQVREAADSGTWALSLIHI